MGRVDKFTAAAEGLLVEKDCTTCRLCGKIDGEVREMELLVRSAREYTAESLARSMLAQAATVPPGDIVFSRNENGKPLPNLPLHFNCSHSGDYVACAVSEREIGLDMERIRPVHQRMERTLTEAERQWLARLPVQARDEGFLRLWTLKESWIKCRGGRLMEFRQAEFVLQGFQILSAPRGFDFRFLPAPAGYVLTACERI